MAVAPNAFLGFGFHGIGATCASTCYTPQKKVKGWSWQTYWITQAAVCWLILPFVGAWLLVPNFAAVFTHTFQDDKLRSAAITAFLYGMLYGVGGTAFGIAIRYIGFSLTYAVAIGISSVLGTIVPAILGGTMGDVVSKPGWSWALLGIVISTVGIALIGWAGRSREKDVQDKNAAKGFSMGKGLAIAILAGVLSAVYAVALGAPKPIVDYADPAGNNIYSGLLSFVFANPGAFLTTAIYCIFLTVRHKTAGEFVQLPASEEQASLPINFLMAIITGFLWYSQFFFYNLGHIHLSTNLQFSSWTIHMTMLVLISNIVGFLLLEWAQARPITRTRLFVALAVLMVSIGCISVGNYVDDKADQKKKADDASATPLAIPPASAIATASMPGG
jgi:L-rhamnose-H+ transport protein